MELNQTTQSTVDQTATNKKMANCKTCGMPMAKNAKKCPSCGATNTKRRRKKILTLVAFL